MSAALTANAASFAIGSVALVERVDLRVEPGELIAIVGPNGAGKSTLLRMLSGDVRPTAGAVRMANRDLSTYSPRELAGRRAVLAQHTNVGFPFSVEEIVWMGADIDRRKAAPLFDRAIREVRLEAFRHRDVTTLSGGEQQRTHFARVLLQLWCGEASYGPGLLLLDEPTSSLDIRHQLDLAEMARRCARDGTTVIAILHDLNLAARFADRILMMHQGALTADGTPSAVIRPDLLARVFDVDLSVSRDSTGAPFVLPQLAKR
ncbi:ABC transporter related [Rhodopseudomonas palustris BisB5]|uniref:Hemin import ATP-binding protein HmuV n=1 Tax=Rhodopseudomonas palustris (strain BisB5) TaxID=316057 RepID=HMUV_RHOPS|nr:RecName: Full=Hemin import ATP-binding protein HmuV [Rhodopseudomonas palustris BisB5]ABE39580.1 ABC transporter related [Rhodopseudomonas palustris BisB5]